MTTSTVSLNIRMDKNLKNNLSELCDELGMNVSTAFTIFAKAMVRKGGIPFDVALDEPNKATLSAIREVEEMKKNPSKYKSYTDVDKMMEDLLK